MDSDGLFSERGPGPLRYSDDFLGQVTIDLAQVRQYLEGSIVYLHDVFGWCL